MKNTLETKLIFYLTAIIILINLVFQGGWDLWVQTLTYILTILLLCIYIRRNILISKIMLSLPFFILLTGLVISYLNSSTPVTSLIYFCNYINYLLIFLISTLYFTRGKYQEKIFKFIIFSGALAASLDLLYPVFFHTALFPNPNIKVGFLLLVIPVYYNKLNNIKPGQLKPKQFPLLLFFILIMISFYNAHSGWGNVVFIFSIILYFCIVKKIKKLAVQLIFILLFAAVLYILTKSPQDIINRLCWIKSGIKMFLQRPVTGFGMGSVSHILPAFIPDTRNFSLYVHSFFIQFAAENGIFSILGLLWLLILIFKKILVQKNYKNRVIFVSLISLMIYNLFEYNLSIPLIALFFWFLLGSFSNFPFYVVSFRRKLHQYIFYILSFFVLFGLIGTTVMKPFLSTMYFSKGIYNLRIENLSQADNLFKGSLEICPDYHLPRLGLALKNIQENDLKNARKNISLSFPIKEGNPPYTTFNNGVALLKQNNEYDARIKFLKVIWFRLTQYGLDPKDYMVPIHE